MSDIYIQIGKLRGKNYEWKFIHFRPIVYAKHFPLC